MKITDVRCVEYFGALTSDEPFGANACAAPSTCIRSSPAVARSNCVTSTMARWKCGRSSCTSTPMRASPALPWCCRLSRPTPYSPRCGPWSSAPTHSPASGYETLLPVDDHGWAGTGVAMSALDCALWDIRGQFFACRPHAARRPHPLRRSGLRIHTRPAARPDHVTARTRDLRALGFGWTSSGSHAGVETTVTMGWTRSFSSSRRSARAGGDDLDIMLDAWRSWDAPFTVAVARDAEHSVRWIEEPLLPDYSAGYAALRTCGGGHRDRRRRT